MEQTKFLGTDNGVSRISFGFRVRTSRHQLLKMFVSRNSLRNLPCAS